MNQEINPLPNQFDIIHGYPINYKHLLSGQKTNFNQNLSLAREHYMLVLQVYEDEHYVFGCWGTSKKEELKYYPEDNDFIIKNPSKNTKLPKDTLFQMHPRSLNLLPYEDTYFKSVKNNITKQYYSPVVGYLTNDQIEELKIIYKKYNEIQRINDRLVDKSEYILPLDEHEDIKYRLPLSTWKIK